MNRIFLLILITILFSCKSPSQEHKDSRNTPESITQLKESFKKKEERLFLDSFPKDFKNFKSTFGWDDNKDSPGVLYNEANNYIDYWFSLIQKSEYENYNTNIIHISKGGQWDADAIDYFRNKSLQYIKETHKYSLINSLNYKDASSVLSFLFISPNPQYDKAFFSSLSQDKQQIVEQLFSNQTSIQKKRATFSTYENNKDYFIKSFDVNKDGVSDKIVSNKPYQGDDLFVFFGNKSGDYSLSLETVNFSEDGGNIIQDIIPISNSKGLIVKTYFPDRGYYEKEYNIVPENNVWILKNIVYKTMSDVSENAVKYICDVTQNIDITKSGWTTKINPIPEENVRNKKCKIEKSGVTAKKEYYIQDSDGYTNLRKERTTTSMVLQKIKSGEKVEVLDNSGDWYLVRTGEGKEGYVYKNRVKSN